MCNCNIVSIEPTIETSWNMEDKYAIKCNICKETLFTGNIDEISDYILKNECNVENGEKYLPNKILNKIK